MINEFDDINDIVEILHRIACGDEEFSYGNDINKLFKESVNDYKRISRRCEFEGININDELDEYKNEFKESQSVVDRVNIIEAIQNDIKNMVNVCDNPPKSILSKYSEDLVSRIENGIIVSEFDVDEE